LSGVCRVVESLQEVCIAEVGIFDAGNARWLCLIEEPTFKLTTMWSKIVGKIL